MFLRCWNTSKSEGKTYNLEMQEEETESQLLYKYDSEWTY